MATFAETSLPRLLAGLARDGFEGTLTLSCGRTTRTWRWQGGRPVSVTSSRPEDSLASLLVERGTIDEATAERARSSATARDKGELAALAAARVAPKELLMGHAEHLRRGLVEAFGWPPEATVAFSHEPGDGSAPRVPIDVADVVRAGLARHWRPDQLFAELGDRLSAFPRPREAAPAPDAAAQPILAACDGRRTAFAILRDHATPESLAAFWWLDVTGRLDWASEPAVGDAEPGTAVDEAPADLGPEIEIVLAGASEVATAQAQGAESKQAGTALDDRGAALREEILGLSERLADMTYYELLGIERDAKPAQIKKAYLKAAKRLHPDAFGRLGLDDIKDTANGVFAEITKAHATLSDPREREAYDASLEGHTSVDANQLAQAEMLFRKGEVLMKAGNFLDAHELLAAAVKLWPEEAEYQAALAWTLHRKTPPESELAVEHFERALELGGPNAQLLLRMSYAVKEAGDTDRAAELARDAKSLDPRVRA